MPKSLKIYHTIGEVADKFNVSTSLIRFWEKEFDILKPKKNKKGNRLFTERDMHYLHMIYQLVKMEGYTLQGARDALKKDFGVIEEKTVQLETLQRLHSFLKDLDKVMEAKQKA